MTPDNAGTADKKNGCCDICMPHCPKPEKPTFVNLFRDNIDPSKFDCAEQRRGGIATQSAEGSGGIGRVGTSRSEESHRSRTPRGIVVGQISPTVAIGDGRLCRVRD